jgi:hypothetical protein
MTNNLQPAIVFRILFQPQAVMRDLANSNLSASSVFFRIAIWLGLIPPVFAFIGASIFGWQLGAVEPLHLPAATLVGISIAYYITLLFGFVSTALVSQWMATTYGASGSLGTHFAMITVVGTPLVVGSVIHLYPHAFINVLVLVPLLIWSMNLLYRGLPVALRTTPERGMLMASSLIGYLLVAMVSLLGITVVLWGWGLGPALGI